MILNLRFSESPNLTNLTAKTIAYAALGIQWKAQKSSTLFELSESFKSLKSLAKSLFRRLQFVRVLKLISKLEYSDSEFRSVKIPTLDRSTLKTF